LDTRKALECLRNTREGYGCAIARERNRAMAELVNGDVRKALGEARPSCNGKSIIDLIWEQLLEAYDDLLEVQPLAERTTDIRAQAALWHQKGACLGLATALAILHNPYSPDIDAIRKECVERYENR
jgi:hypothetical protein